MDRRERKGRRGKEGNEKGKTGKGREGREGKGEVGRERKWRGSTLPPPSLAKKLLWAPMQPVIDVTHARHGLAGGPVQLVIQSRIAA